MKHNFEISYTQQGDYLLPDLRLPEQPKVEIGIWGKRHLRHIEKYHKIRYTNLLTSCKLTSYLADIDEQAEEMFFRLVNQLAEKEGVTEQLKADDQMLWGAGLRWRPLPQAEAPTEPTGETANEQYPQPRNGDCKCRVDLCIIKSSEGELFIFARLFFYSFIICFNGIFFID